MFDLVFYMGQTYNEGEPEKIKKQKQFWLPSD